MIKKTLLTSALLLVASTVFAAQQPYPNALDKVEPSDLSAKDLKQYNKNFKTNVKVEQQYPTALDRVEPSDLSSQDLEQYNKNLKVSVNQS